MQLTINVTEKNKGVYILHPIGSIDSDTCTILEKRINSLIESEATTIIIDMEKVLYITSLGIGVIINANKTLEHNKGMLLLINLPASIKKVFDLINALPSQRIYVNREELDQYLIRMQQPKDRCI
ncbi:MAG: STAS domain-containing protein [Candidatus Omnitrophica bacterium]|nr:STAS domain-containing protein [Candidatus Omnitrophota bacterium]